MYIDVLGSWDTGGRRLTINSGFSYYPSTPDFTFRAGTGRDGGTSRDVCCVGRDVGDVRWGSSAGHSI